MNTDTTSPPRYPFFLAGEWQQGTEQYNVQNPYTNDVVGIVDLASPDELEQAIQAAVQAFETTRTIPSHQRSTILRRISEHLQADREDMARTIAQEAAKPIKYARAEVERAIFTFACAAEEANRISGDVLPMDVLAAGEGRQAIAKRFPIGPIAAITPFNFPLNLVAHKLAPAIAAGCPVVLKPASQTPITALKLAHIIDQAGLPKGALSVIVLHNSDASPLVEDDRFKLLSFTGSPAVGWDMKRRAGQKRVALELGGNAGVIIHEDANLAFASTRVVAGGFAQAGQSCISVQRVLVHSQIYKKFMSLFVPTVRQLKVGDPLDEESDLSVLITPNEGARVAEWLEEAKAAGAEVVAGGQIQGAIVEPTVLVNAANHLKVNCQEIFAPVVTIQPYDDFNDALAVINDSDFGLQAGVFTNNLTLAWRAYETLDVGGVIINDVPTWRADHMPYGGVKQSGIGREGVKYAIEEMTEPRLLVLNFQN